ALCDSFFLSFFFSSRRRHTRFSRDWSSDVWSSDLFFCPRCGSPVFARSGDEIEVNLGSLDTPDQLAPTYELWTIRRESWLPPFQIGRASCRESVVFSVVSGPIMGAPPGTEPQPRRG